MLKSEIGGILRIAPERIDENRSLTDMGLDSLMKLELATAVEGRFSVTLPVMALSEFDTVSKLGARLVQHFAAATQETESTDGRMPAAGPDSQVAAGGEAIESGSPQSAGHADTERVVP